MLSTTLKNVECWDEQLAKIMFGYRCEIQANTKFFPFLIMTGCTPRLKTDNNLHFRTTMIDDIVDATTNVKQFFQKMKLIANIHENVLFNVKQAQKKQKKTYATKKGKQTFEGLVVGQTMVKMKKPRKNKTLISSWERPYQFVGHVNGNGNFDFEKGSKVCIIKDVDGHQWERSCRDLQIYHVLQD